MDGLAFLANNLLACIPNAFAFIRLRRIVAPNLSSNATNYLLVASIDGDLGILPNHDLYSGGNWIQYGMVNPGGKNDKISCDLSL